MIDCENCIHVQMCKWCDEMVKTHTCDYYETCDSFEPKRPQGEWKYVPYGYLSTYKCSNCGFYGDKQWIFCPYCGSDNKKEGDEK